MPFADRTGPWGQGPLTGRARGYCTRRARTAAFGRRNAPPGGAQRFGRSRGRRSGWGNRGYGFSGRGPALGGWGPPPVPRSVELSAAQETRRLKAMAADAKAELDAIEARLAQLQAQPARSDPGEDAHA